MTIAFTYGWRRDEILTLERMMISGHETRAVFDRSLIVSRGDLGRRRKAE